MGDIAVFIYRHGRAILAWGIFISGAAIFFAALSRYDAIGYASNSFTYAIQYVTSAITAIPSAVSQFNSSIQEALEDSNGIAQLLFWLCGLDVVQSIVSFVVAQINTIVAAVVFVGTSSIFFAGLLFALRRTQRWVRATSGGDLNVDISD